MRFGTCGYCNVDTAGNHEIGCPYAPTTTTDAAMLGVEFKTEKVAPKVKLPLDIIAELNAMRAKLNDMTAQEQDDKINDLLCSAFEAVDAAYDEAVELAHDEPEESNAPPVPMR